MVALPAASNNHAPPCAQPGIVVAAPLVAPACLVRKSAVAHVHLVPIVQLANQKAVQLGRGPSSQWKMLRVTLLAVLSTNVTTVAIHAMLLMAFVRRCQTVHLIPVSVMLVIIALLAVRHHALVIPAPRPRSRLNHPQQHPPMLQRVLLPTIRVTMGATAATKALEASVLFQTAIRMAGRVSVLLRMCVPMAALLHTFITPAH